MQALCEEVPLAVLVADVDVGQARAPAVVAYALALHPDLVSEVAGGVA